MSRTIKGAGHSGHAAAYAFLSYNRDPRIYDHPRAAGIIYHRRRWRRYVYRVCRAAVYYYPPVVAVIITIIPAAALPVFGLVFVFAVVLSPVMLTVITIITSPSPSLRLGREYNAP